MPDPVAERLYAAGLLHFPEVYEECQALVPPRRIQDTLARNVVYSIGELIDADEPVDFVSLDRQMRRSGNPLRPDDLELLGGPDLPNGAKSALHWAKDLHKQLCEGDVGRLASDVADEPWNRLKVAKLEDAQERLRDSNQGREIATEDLGYSGDRLRSLEDEAEPELIKGLIPLGHMSLLVGSTNAGKSSWAGIIAMAQSMGISPWVGAERLPEGRVWVLCPDDSVKSINRKYRRLCAIHFGEEYSHKWEDNVTITAISPDQKIGFWDQCRLDVNGASWIDRQLLQAEDEGRPFSGVICDAMVDFLPEGVSENDNAEVSRALSYLEAICAKRDGFWGLMLTHSGHINEARAMNPRHAARGASSIGAKARSIITIVEPQGSPKVRVISSRANEGLPIPPLNFEVAEQGDTDNALRYFRIIENRRYGAQEMIDPDEIISERELMFRLWEKETGEEKPRKDEDGNHIRLVRSLRNRLKKQVAAWISGQEIIPTEGGFRLRVDVE